MLIILIIVIYIIFRIEGKKEEAETKNIINQKVEENIIENTLNENDVQSNEISNTIVNSYNENIYHDECAVPYDIEDNKYYIDAENGDVIGAGDSSD